jgi:hypothetical protein
VLRKRRSGVSSRETDVVRWLEGVSADAVAMAQVFVRGRARLTVGRPREPL